MAAGAQPRGHPTSIRGYDSGLVSHLAIFNVPIKVAVAHLSRLARMNQSA